jgi:hypothetical protein
MMRARIGGSRHLAAWLNRPEILYRDVLGSKAKMDFAPALV